MAIPHRVRRHVVALQVAQRLDAGVDGCGSEGGSQVGRVGSHKDQAARSTLWAVVVRRRAGRLRRGSRRGAQLARVCGIIALSVLRSRACCARMPLVVRAPQTSTHLVNANATMMTWQGKESTCE